MSIAAFILGESGSGKSASLRNLDPAQTLLIQAVRKPLPFKAPGWAAYDKFRKTGNIIVTDDAPVIEKAMRTFTQPIVVIDDWQYILANEFMRRSHEKGFEKFTDIGRNAWEIITAACGLSEHRRVYIMAHTTTDDNGIVKVKTIGKLLDEKITVEGMVSIVLRTMVQDGQYKFRTHNSGSDTVKTPMGMFAEDFIDNDLATVDAAICNYYEISTPAPLAAAA